MKEALLQIVMSGLGTLGFALCFHVRGHHLLTATLGGMLAWACYLAVYQGTKSLFIGSVLAAMAVCLWSEGAARIRKAPANTFLLPGIIPLLPGGMLYYAMSGLVNGEVDVFLQQGSSTAFAAVGIATGIVAASEIVSFLTMISPKRWGKPGGGQGQ